MLLQEFFSGVLKTARCIYDAANCPSALSLLLDINKHRLDVSEELVEALSLGSLSNQFVVAMSTAHSVDEVIFSGLEEDWQICPRDLLGGACRKITIGDLSDRDRARIGLTVWVATLRLVALCLDDRLDLL